MKNVPAYLFLFIVLLASCRQNAHSKKDSGIQKSKSKGNLNLIKIDMSTLPSTKHPIVLRTDFSNETEWKKICDEIITPNPEFGFIPYVVFASDTSFQNYTEDQLLSDSSTQYHHAFIFIVDKQTMNNPEHPILCLGLKHNRGLKLRTIPSEMWGIENNLSNSNIDFEELSNAVDKEGIFRGFKE
jgi:hypothetical protein